MHHSNPADHARHDASLIAGHAAGDLGDADRARADALISTCSPCAELRRDLVSIAAATRSLPAPFTAARDFRLDADQAEHLRRGSWLRAVLRPFGAGASPLRPLAAGLTSLGVAGLLVATVIPGLFGSAAAPGSRPEAFEAAGDNTTQGAAPGATAGAAPPATVGAAHPVAAPPSQVVVLDRGSTSGYAEHGGTSSHPAGSPVQAAAGGRGTHETDKSRLGSGTDLASTPAVNPLIAGSTGLLVVGLLLFGLRFAARRLR